METIYIRKQSPPGSSDPPQFVVPAVSLKTQKGDRLIPHPYGNETTSFSTLEQSLEQVHRAGYAAEFEGKHYPLPPHRGAERPRVRLPQPGKTPGRKILEEAIPALREQLQDSAPSVVASAAYALGVLKDEGAIPGFIHALQHDDATVRKQVGEALAKLGRPAVNALHTALNDKHWLVRHSALAAVTELTHHQIELASELLPAVLPLLKDESWLVRSQAAMVIGEAASVMQMLEEKSLNNPMPPKPGS